MDSSPFVHPRRLPKNVDGPFYTLGHLYSGADRTSTQEWCGDCCQCEAPEEEAPELLAPLNDNNLDTHFVRQPQTLEEVERACRAIEVCCTSALRYGGQDRAIIERLRNNPEYCDYCIGKDGGLWLTLDEAGDLTPRAERIAVALNAERIRLLRGPRWWQFWKRWRASR